MANSLTNVDIERQEMDMDSLSRAESTTQQGVLDSTPRAVSAVIQLRTRNDNSDDPIILRHRALHCLFGLPTDHISEWSGLLCFFGHLELLFEQLLEPCFNHIWPIIGRSVPKSSLEGWHWCFAVIDAYGLCTTQDPSIESIYRRLCQPGSIQTAGRRCETSPEEKAYILQAIFAVICWTSGTLTPLLGNEAALHLSKITVAGASDGTDTPVTLLAENCSRIYSTNELRRPTRKMFYSFLLRSDINESLAFARTRAPLLERIRNPDSGVGDMLHVSSLNYGSLHAIGGVKIKWVGVLTAHLYFDRVKRELSVYQYPSFCAAKILSNQKIDVVESITRIMLPSEDSFGLSEEPDSVYREILLSYRVLFGQSETSRKLMRRMLGSFKLSSGRATPGHKSRCYQGEKDGFLETLCSLALYPGRHLSQLGFRRQPIPCIEGRLFPISSLSAGNELIESDTYSAKDDFPVFGSRLLTLQRYNMRRQPSKLSDVGRDKRNLVQWYTFWAVVIIGGCGLVLAALQLLVGVVQVVYAIRP
ncbi:hypothetical protein ONS95_006359 [Cadophora gregata]|uniref:uncharacterized protein n=1 Tax=Cadophora gregata TaxID=51156 RepID=UPI0026DCB0D2|nr:uncharacterized protein ONS95_006359 [Cadophora gregata]KAK0099271.1 hypothetical protein ONS96_008505 [Cadophora gregata f. sp. sojae]KAK0102762.1 hypothetical protein ONS95_006359 [Cadophora gregata]